MKVNSHFYDLLVKNEQDTKKNILVFQGGSGCFTGETLVLTSEGHKKIKDIRLGEIVYSLNPKTDKIVKNRVIDRFINKGEHTLIELNTKYGKIKTTENHLFLSEGYWMSARELAKRVMERNSKHREQLSDKQHWKTQNYELEIEQEDKVNETCIKRRILSNSYNNERKTNASVCPSFSGRSIYTQSPKQARSKSQKFKSQRQLCRKLGMGNSQRKYATFNKTGQILFCSRREEWEKQIDRERSKRDKAKIQAESLYGQRSCKRVWGFSFNNKGHPISKKNLEARSLRIEDIISARTYKKSIDTFDLSTEKKNFLITKDNLIVHNSGKTYSILQFFIIKCTSGEWQNETIDIVRDTFPFLRISAMKDFFDILESEGLYDENRHNKSENTYRIGTNKIRFYSADDKEKTKGPRRTRLYLNEVLGFKKSTVDQLMMRTSKKIYMDYNPSEEFSWVYDDILPDDRTLFDKSNFLDNPFIPEVSKEHIKKYKQTDPNLWRIYGLGDRGVSHTTIFFNWEQTDCTWERAEGEEVFGMDFGFNDPTVLIRAKFHQAGIFAEQLIYQTGLTSEQIVAKMDKLREEGKIKYSDKIICDSARPEIIEDLRRAGYNVWKAKKGDESVLRGINFIKRHRIFISQESTDMIKEFRGYKWQVDKDEHVLDFPVQLNDHCIDSLRYALEDKSRNRKTAGFGEV